MNRPTKHPAWLQTMGERRSVIYRFQLAALAAFVLFTSPRIASAGLLTDVSFAREIFINGLVDPSVTLSSPIFMGNSIPAQQRFDIASIDGGTASVIYTFSDTGSFAEFKIETAFTISGNDGFQESGGATNLDDILFTTSKPLQFTLNGTFSVFHSAPGDTVEVGQGVILNSILGSPINQNPLMPISGVLPGNVAFGILTEFFAYSQIHAGIIGGSSTFDLVLTPVPEPSSAALLIVGAFALIFIQRRVVRSHDPFNDRRSCKSFVSF